MKKILIIDNSIAIRNIIRNLFTDNQRILIYEANSKEETEKLIKENKFFIIISNLFLNDSSDLEILNLFEKENIPTIIFSSVLETELLNKYSNLYFNKILNKTKSKTHDQLSYNKHYISNNKSQKTRKTKQKRKFLLEKKKTS